jgi:dimethylargininase
MARVFDFDQALVRTPARSVTGGLRAGSGPDPEYDGVRAEHAAYVRALLAAGLQVEVLPPLDAFPDSVFVEDPALVFPEAAILLRPGAASRAGEAAALRPALERRFPVVLELSEGFADGGDVLVTPQEVLIGLSSRTDRQGAEALATLLDGLGRSARIVEPPPGVLHLKTACSLVDETTALAAPALAAADLLGDLELIVTPPGEEAAANALRLNEVVLLGAAFPATRRLIEGRGIGVVPLHVDEIACIDAGLSCMSLRW